MDEIFALGVVAVGYRVVKDEHASDLTKSDWGPYENADNKGIIVPYVIKETLGRSYFITVGEDNGCPGQAIFRFYRANVMGKPAIYDPTVRVHSGFGYDPDMMTGSLNSIAISIVREEYYISRQYLYSLRQSNLASDGSLVLESTETNTQLEVKPIGYYADADAAKKSRETAFTESIEDQEQRRILQQEQRRRLIEQEMKQQTELANNVIDLLQSIIISTNSRFNLPRKLGNA